LIQYDIFLGDHTQSPQRLQLVIAKEDWVGRDANKERLRLIVPHHASLSVRDAECVS